MSEVKTTNATPTAALRWPTPLQGRPWPPLQPPRAADCAPLEGGSIVQVRVRAVAMGDNGQCATYERVALFARYPNANIIKIGPTAEVVTIEDDAAWDLTMVATGQIVEVLVTGAAAASVKWTLFAEVLKGAHP